MHVLWQKQKLLSFLVLFSLANATACTPQKSTSSVISRSNSYGNREVTFEETEFAVYEKNFYNYSWLNADSRVIAFDLDSVAGFSSKYVMSGFATVSSIVSSFIPCRMSSTVLSFEYDWKREESTDSDIHLEYEFSECIYQISDFTKDNITFQYDSENKILDFVYAGIHLFQAGLSFENDITEEEKESFFDTLKNKARYLE